MIAPDAYVLPFTAGFDAPPGTLLECLGTRGWRYRDPRTGADVVVRDHQANSYARTTGGMVGSRWRVAEVAASSDDGVVLVRLDPAWPDHR